MQKAIWYEIGGSLYTWDGSRLVKAGRKFKPSPGQMDLGIDLPSTPEPSPLQTGMTRTIGGKTYRFNENSRWERVETPAGTVAGLNVIQDEPASMFDAKLKRDDLAGAIDHSILEAERGQQEARQGVRSLRRKQRKLEQMSQAALDKHQLIPDGITADEHISNLKESIAADEEILPRLWGDAEKTYKERIARNKAELVSLEGVNEPEEKKDDFKNFDNPWAVMSPEDRKEADRLTRLSMKAYPGSPKQRKFQEQRQVLFDKYGIGGAKPEPTEPEKSIGHIGFDGRWEYIKLPSGDIGRADISDPIATDGRRFARFESTEAGWASHPFNRGSDSDDRPVNEFATPEQLENMSPDLRMAHDFMSQNYYTNEDPDIDLMNFAGNVNGLAEELKDLSVSRTPLNPDGTRSQDYADVVVRIPGMPHPVRARLYSEGGKGRAKGNTYLSLVYPKIGKSESKALGLVDVAPMMEKIQVRLPIGGKDAKLTHEATIFSPDEWSDYKAERQNSLTKSALYQVGNYLYRWDGDRLVKASKVAPGQMSLFEENLHPRGADGKFVKKGQEGAGRGEDGKWDGDHDGYEARLTEYAQQASPTIEKEFKSGIDAFRSKIKSMTVAELEDLDVDGYLNDEILYPLLMAADKEAKSWEHEDAHGYLDLGDVLETVNPRINKMYDAAYEELDDLVTKRMERPEEIASEAASEMNIKGGELLENEPSTFQEALELRQKLKNLYNSIQNSYVDELDELGVEEADWEDLDGELEWMLDEYSDDPDDWEDDDDDDDDPNADNGMAAAQELHEKGHQLIDQNRPESVEEWQQLKSQLTKLGEEIKAKHNGVTVKNGIWDEFDAEIEDLLDQYSDDPELWEDI